MKATLEKAFDRWGVPQRIRVDNGSPWGTSNDLPPELALWLIGLEIEMIWNPPRQPQHNGVVERSQGTAKRWSEPKTCRTAAELAKRIAVVDRHQREVYPSVCGRSRLAAHPELTRAEPSSWRRKPWSLERVLEHLAGYTLPRRVDKVGKASVYGRDVYVGKGSIGRRVYISLDPIAKRWVVAAEDGPMLNSVPADELNEANIQALRLLPDDRRRRFAAKLLRHPTPAKLPRR